MATSAGIIFLVTGLALLLFGLFLFYAYLPLLFAFIGFDAGLLFGRWLTGDIGVIALALGIVAAAVLGVSAYSLEPYRRIFLGASSGFLVGLAIVAGLGLEGWFSSLVNLFLPLAVGLIGAFLVLYFFDAFVIIATAFGGAGLAVAGVKLLLRGELSSGIGEYWSGILIIALAVVGIVWQRTNASKWVQWFPAPHAPGKDA